MKGFRERKGRRIRAGFWMGLVISCSFFALIFTGCDKSKDKEAEGLKDTEQAEEEAPIIVIRSEDINFDVEIDRQEEPKEEEEQEEGFVYEEILDFENRIFSKETEDLDQAVLTFAGDICFAESYSNMNEFYNRGGNISGVIEDSILSGLKGSDIFMVNNEFPYSNRGTPTAGKKFTFRARPESVSNLKDMGADIVSLANNHAYDYGKDALIDTMDTLSGAGIPFVGAGNDITEAMMPVYYKINGRTIAFTSATQIERTGNPDTREATEDSPGVLRTLNSSKMVECIKEAAENSDFVIVYVHWGSENTDLVDESQKKLAADYAAAGADLIIGDHSHCLQGIDYVGGVPVFYSLGNFWFNSRTIDTGYARVTLDTSQDKEEVEIKSFEFIPCIQRGCHTRLASDEDKVRILSYLQGISNYAEIGEDGFITQSDKNHNIQNGQNTSPSKEFLQPTPDPEAQEADPASLIPGMELLVPDPELLMQIQAAQEQAAQAAASQEEVPGNEASEEEGAGE